ncbi:hypothetical protein CHISP_1670 [Chitinispirillum alkaliphilum]|nr:hypothetical protein CHISP_1670 [Chitinispirillum alkaliphilum]
MPIFEYRCTECNHTYEELITGDLNQKVPCPACNSIATDKLMSAIGAISMGSSPSGPCPGGCSGMSSCAAAMQGGCPQG